MWHAAPESHLTGALTGIVAASIATACSLLLLDSAYATTVRTLRAAPPQASAGTSG
jgi:hypothetical protein